MLLRFRGLPRPTVAGTCNPDTQLFYEKSKTPSPGQVSASLAFSSPLNLLTDTHRFLYHVSHDTRIHLGDAQIVAVIFGTTWGVGAPSANSSSCKLLT